MLAESLPPCLLCHGTSYSPGGAHISPYGAQQWFTCEGCFARIFHYASGVAYLVFLPEGADGGEEEPFGKWFSNVVAVTARDFRVRRDAAKKRKWLDFLPGFLERHGVTETEPGCIAYRQLPTQEAKDEIDAWTKEENNLPGFKDSPSLAQIPRGLRVLRHTERGWEEQDTEDSWFLVPPRDPITVHNEEYWGGIFAELGIEGAKESPNRYDSGATNRPWYEFSLGHATFEVGWRTRVVQLSVKLPIEADCKPLRALAERDNVTYSEGKTLMIHAHTRATCLEHLRTMIEIARAS